MAVVPRPNRGRDGRAITSHWKVVGYPTLYLLDHHGIIRKRWIGGPPPEDITHMAEILIDAARRNLTPELMHPVVAALPLPAFHGAQGPPARPATANAPRPGTGFLDKLYREADGSKSNMSCSFRHVHRRHGRTGDPVLARVGRRGSDGRSQVVSGLAKAIRERNEDFYVPGDLPASPRRGRAGRPSPRAGKTSSLHPGAGAVSIVSTRIGSR